MYIPSLSQSLQVYQWKSNDFTEEESGSEQQDTTFIKSYSRNELFLPLERDPGLPMTTAVFPSSSNSTVFRIVGDVEMVPQLTERIHFHCSTFLDLPRATPLPAPPKLEQVVRFHPEINVAVTLDGYDNSQPFPSDADAKLFVCLETNIRITELAIDSEGHIHWGSEEGPPWWIRFNQGAVMVYACVMISYILFLIIRNARRASATRRASPAQVGEMSENTPLIS